MVFNNEKQGTVADSSSSSTAAADQPDQDHIHEPHDKERQQDRDLEAGRPSAEEEQPTTSFSDDEDASSHHGDGDDEDPGGAPVAVARISTNLSLGPDNPVEHYTSYVEVPDAVYDRFSPRRKLLLVALLSYCAFLAPISSTTVLSATPEVAAEFRTTGAIVNVTNALYMLFMGISPIVWGPFSEVWGRKTVSCSCPPPPGGLYSTRGCRKSDWCCVARIQAGTDGGFILISYYC